MTKKHSLLRTALAAALTFGAVGNAGAHSVSIGYENAGSGAVTVWLGTYDHGTTTNEGSLTLQGANATVYGPVTLAFNLLTSIKPLGLIDGTTNFYAPNATIGSSAPLSGSEAGFLLACSACGPVDHWQGVTFASLTAGDYQFTWVPAVFPTQEWSPLNTNMNGIFNLSGVVNPTSTPEPGSLALLSLGLAGLAAARRRKA